MIDNLVRKEVTNKVSSDPFVHCVLNDGTIEDGNLEVLVHAQVLEASSQSPRTFANIGE